MSLLAGKGAALVLVQEFSLDPSLESLPVIMGISASSFMLSMTNQFQNEFASRDLAERAADLGWPRLPA